MTQPDTVTPRSPFGRPDLTWPELARSDLLSRTAVTQPSRPTR